jgi:diphthamide synthase (EF-2-diphthine--ammonia ligase)
MKKKTLISWSSGKDSAWALHLLRQDPGIELLGLFTAMNQKYSRVSMHATRLEMLQRQPEAVGLPIECANKGIECLAFGDLFLEDIRKYRENQLKGTGIEPLFPLWGIPTSDLAEQMLSAGLEAYVSSVDLNKLPSRFAGQKWSRDLIAEFPKDCDPCGENGEIHTVVVGGPMFRNTILVRVGDVVNRNGFAYADIIPVN